MNLWKKIDNFFAPKPYEKEGAAAAAAAAADIPLYVAGLITRPERAKDLLQRVEQFKKMASDEQAEELMPLYFDLEVYIIENEPVKKYTKESLRLEVYKVLDLKNSRLPFVGFFTPSIDGALLLITELFSKWAGPAFDVLGKRRVGEIILSALEGTAFDGAEYNDGIMDFSAIYLRLESNIPPDDEFRKVFNKVSDDVVLPIQALRGVTPSEYFLRKKILNEWQMLNPHKQLAWQEQKAVIPITPQAREIITSVGMGELITRGVITGVETELVPKQGDAKAVSVTASALKDEQGNISGMVIAAKDLTEIQRLEQERIVALQTANLQAEGLVKERTADLEAAKTELESKVFELERFNKVAVGRELKMVELKKEIARMKDEKGNG
jgi:hypothetical protein